MFWLGLPPGMNLTVGEKPLKDTGHPPSPWLTFLLPGTDCICSPAFSIQVLQVV